MQRDGEPRIRLNYKDTVADDGSIYRHTVVYQQWRNQRSNLDRYNLRTGRWGNLPRQVNTSRASETDPTLSGRYLLFTRNYRKDQHAVSKVLLYDRKTKTLRKLDQTTSWVGDSLDSWLTAGQVNGPWAVWSSGNSYEDSGTYRIYRYNIRRDATTRVGPPLEDAYYTPPDPAISSDGTVYFVRRPNESQREVVKAPLEAPEQVIYTVGAGATLGQLCVDDRAKARHVYFTASEPESGIYKLVEPLP